MRLAVVTLFIMIPFILFSQNENAEQPKEISLSLQQARDFALEHNTNIKNAQLDVIIAKKKVWETTAIGLPQASFGVDYSNIFDPPIMDFGYSYFVPTPVYNTPNDPLSGINYMEYNQVSGSNPVELGVKENTTWNITVSQLIFSGEYIVGLQAAKVYKQLSEQNLSKSKNDVTESITQTYFMALMAEENKKILEKSIENTKQIYDEMQKTNNVGLIDKTSVDQLELTYKNLENALNSIDRQVNLSYELLKVQLGANTEQKIILTDNLETIFNNVDVNSLVNADFKIDNNVDFQLISTQEKLMKLSLKREKSAALPTVSAFFMHQQQMEEADFNFFNPNMLGVSVSWPIFTSFGRCSKVQQAKLEHEKSINTKEFVVQNLQIGVLQAKSDLVTAKDKYDNEKENLDLAERIYNEYLVRFKNGTASSIELTQAQNQYLTTQGNYISAMVELLNAKNKLDKTLNNYSK